MRCPYKHNIKFGDRFGRLKIIKEISPYISPGKISSTQRRFLCLCSCGNKIKTILSRLLIKKTTSCGCYRKDLSRKRFTIHGKSNTKEYKTWANMMQRCNNPNNAHYKYYGGRRIKVCARWQKFENFISDMGISPSGSTIERIDNNLGYSLKNCRWAKTYIEQVLNRSMTKFITFNGETLCHADWSKKLGGSHGLVYKRIKLGWDPIMAVTTPIIKI